MTCSVKFCRDTQCVVTYAKSSSKMSKTKAVSLCRKHFGQHCDGIELEV